MSNNALLTPGIIAKETLMHVENNLAMAKRVNRVYQNQFQNFIGEELTVRKPVKFNVVDGPLLQVQDIKEQNVKFRINKRKQVAFTFSGKDRQMIIEDFAGRYLKGAAVAIANQIDSDLLELYKDVYNFAGTPGTVPNSLATSTMPVDIRLSNSACPEQDRYMVCNPLTYTTITSGLSQVYVQSVAEPAYKGFVPNISNFEVCKGQNVWTNVAGNYSGAFQVIGANQSGGSITVRAANATTAAAPFLRVGNVITFAGVNAVNPVSRRPTGQIAQFVVTEDLVTGANTDVTLKVSPAMVLSGPYQNVTALPANNAAITVVSGAANGEYAQNLAFHRDAFGLACVPLDVPMDVEFAANYTHDGISVRVVAKYDINNDIYPCRIDVLYGVTTFYPELACRLTA